MHENITPLTRRETRVYLPNVAGGFDLRGCPDAENLAAFIVKACNSHDALVAALKEMVEAYESHLPDHVNAEWYDEYNNAIAALAKAEE